MYFRFVHIFIINHVCDLFTRSQQPVRSQSMKPRVDVQMTSILNLRNAVKKSEHPGKCPIYI